MRLLQLLPAPPPTTINNNVRESFRPPNISHPDLGAALDLHPVLVLHVRLREAPQSEHARLRPLVGRVGIAHLQ